MTRTHSSQLVSARGGCNRCTKQWDGVNALALAARHHDNAAHQTWAEQTQRTTYGAVSGKTAGKENRLF